MSTVRAILADDHGLVRAGIQSLMEAIDGVKIVAQAADGREALALAREHRPDLMVMDISMKELNGIEATAQIKSEMPLTRVLILSMHATQDFVHRAIKAGASGYLVKDSAPVELRMAIEAVMRDEIYLSPRVSKHLVAGFLQANDARPVSALEQLTARQREILQLMAEGKSTKEIAFVLEVSVKTVESHRAALMDRLDIRDVAGLVLFAVREGLVSLDRPAE